jgi:hypothetical protein
VFKEMFDEHEVAKGGGEPGDHRPQLPISCATWPWARQLAACFLTAFALPQPKAQQQTPCPRPETPTPARGTRRSPDATVGLAA